MVEGGCWKPELVHVVVQRAWTAAARITHPPPCCSQSIARCRALGSSRVSLLVSWGCSRRPMMVEGGALVYLKCVRGVNTWRPDMLYLQFEEEGRERGGGVIRLRTYVGGGRGALRFLVCVCADGV